MKQLAVKLVHRSSNDAGSSRLLCGEATLAAFVFFEEFIKGPDFSPELACCCFLGFKRSFESGAFAVTKSVKACSGLCC